MDDLVVRHMGKGDIAQIVEIERLSFPAPWAEYAFSSELQNNFAVYFVFEHEHKIIGYTGMWLFSGEAHVTTIAVHPDYRGQGLGKMLLETDVEHARKQGTETVLLEVRPSNIKAISLYKSMGFRQIGWRKNYYVETREDALVMSCKLKQEQPQK